MNIVPINSTNFKGSIKNTPTFSKLLENASSETLSRVYNFKLKAAQHNDDYIFTFARSVRRMSPHPKYYVALIVEKVKEYGERYPLLIKEFESNKLKLSEVCSKNPNILADFATALEKFYNLEKNTSGTFEWHDVQKYYKNKP